MPFEKERSTPSECETDFAAQLGIKRAPVPDTSHLQARIISTSRTIEQRADLGGVTRDTHKSKGLSRFLPMGLMTAAACAVVVLGTVSIVLPLQDKPMQTEMTGQDVYSADELEFQELMLINDELLFAQL